jgi:hypothetical protein
MKRPSSVKPCEMGRFLEKLMGAPEVKPLLSDEHFSVDGTLLQAWASHASLERIDGEEEGSTATAVRPWRGLWRSKARQKTGQG